MFPFNDVIMSGVFWPKFIWLLSPEWCIYASIKWTSIGSGNGLVPNGAQAITWTNVDVLPIGPIGTHCSEIWIEIVIFFIHKNWYGNVVWKMSAILSRPQHVNTLLFGRVQNRSQFWILHVLNKPAKCPVPWYKSTYYFEDIWHISSTQMFLFLTCGIF